MKTDITRQPLSLIAIQFVILLGLFFCRYEYFPLPFELLGAMAAPGFGVATGMPVGDWINSLAATYPLAGKIGLLFFVLLNAFLVTRTMSRNLVFPARTYIPTIFYLTACCGVFFPGGTPSSIITSYLLIQASSLFISSFVRSFSFGTTFRASLLVGSAMIVHAPAVIYILLVPIAMRVFRRGQRETVIAVFGSLLPVLLCAYILWALGGGFSDIFIRLWELLSVQGTIHFTMEVTDMVRILVIALFILYIFLSLGTFVAMSSDLRTRTHKIYIFMIWFMVISLAAMFLPCRSVADLPVLAIPMSFLMPAFFVKHTGLIPTTLYIILVSAIVILNVLPFVL